ncbi:AAA family ATPase [Dactylosporangium sp. NPDC006015]|uniref:helix-turn-helix transcriptional regulator n=1 Tax=Dactylosporangium sp. NPDC006015 TaxID=3154576 RepID=UPI0033BC4972
MAGDRTARAFVGRRTELDRLRHLLRGAGGSAGTGTVLIAGEAGIGKSRLISEFTAAAVAAAGPAGRLHVLSGACINLGVGVPYAPLVDAIRRLVRAHGDDYVTKYGGPAYTELTKLIAGLPGGGPATGAAAEPVSQMRVFGAVLRMLDHLGANGPTILVFEDLHWADPSTLDLVSYLVQYRTDERVLFVFSYRPGREIEGSRLMALLAETTFSARVEHIRLPAFTETELGELLGASVAEELEPAVVRQYHRLTGGNAFFAEELIVDGRLTDPSAGQLPHSLEHLLHSRLHPLGEDARNVVDADAVAGQPVGYDLLATVCELRPRVLDNALRVCDDRQILQLDPQRLTYDFRHALLRQVVLDDLGPGHLRELHTLLAEALTADPSLATEGNPAATLAHHWFEARRWPQALRAALAAAAEAERSQAFRVAQSHYERVLDRLWQLVPDAAAVAGTTEDRLLASAAEAARWAGDLDKALQLLRRAIDGVDAGERPVRAGELHERLGRYLWEQGDNEASVVAYRRADTLLPLEPPSAAKARVLAALATVQLQSGHYRDGLAAARTAVGHARKAGARAEEGRALNAVGVALTLLDEPDQGIPDLLSAVAIAKEVSQLEDLHRAYGNLTVALEHAGRLAESAAVALDELDRCEAAGLQTKSTRVLANNVSTTLVMVGRWDEAESLLTGAIRDRPVRETRYPRLTLAEIHVARGRFGRAAELLRDLRADAGTDPRFLSPLACCLIELALWQREHDAAAEAVDRWIDLLKGTEHVLSLLRFLASALRAAADVPRSEGRQRHQEALAGRLAALEPLLDRARPAEPGSEVDVLSAQCRAELDRARSAATAGQWERVAAGWARLERPYHRAYALWRAAEAAVRTGPKETVTRWAGDANGLARELSAKPLMRAVEELAGAAGVELDPVRMAETSDAPPQPAIPQQRRPAVPWGLTGREMEVLELLTAGETNRKIARRLGIAERTVAVHVGSILRKADVENRQMAAMAAQRLQLFADS